MTGGPPTVLLTGAAGRVGTYLRAGLPRLGWRLRCLDRFLPPEDDGLEWVAGDITDPRDLAVATEGVSAVVHLAGIAHETDFPALLHANIDGTYQVFEAARRAGVRRVLYASSNHAVGRHEAPALLDGAARARPDTLYGVSKAFGEALGSYYADKYGMSVAALRIGSCFERPSELRHLATWLSPGDAVRLTDAVLRAPRLRFATLNGISANSRAWWELDSARAFGYEPQDDAERYAAELLAARGGPLGPGDPDAAYVGGRMAV
ncbi:NAD-dependent epimerase/dehydratase family protein [Streptomyces shenzhenensis]|uniref:NAD-dependent epimerase/dehydratase family protein n=1 Tax=Streptomyces shenzhenensis TaxID=943815 RepID=UPI0015F04B1C|nr:NAD(P)-dependent oxidoreductase [Streptomyces shenzhenensis]